MTAYQQGTTAVLLVQFYAYPGGPAADVTGLTVTITASGGGAAVIGPTAVGIVHEATGLYSYPWVIAVAQALADYVVSWDADGPTQASEVVTVSSSVALLSADDVVTYLRESGASWDTADLQDALDAETAAQRASCRIPAVYPADLRQALLRRTARNLALRALPLAVHQGDAEAGPLLLPGRDPEVRRLEAPHRRLAIG